ncbi:hypothetical protein V2J09_004616 [Rumex salicifolius]
MGRDLRAELLSPLGRRATSVGRFWPASWRRHDTICGSSGVAAHTHLAYRWRRKMNITTMKKTITADIMILLMKIVQNRQNPDEDLGDGEEEEKQHKELDEDLCVVCCEHFIWGCEDVEVGIGLVR